MNSPKSFGGAMLRMAEKATKGERKPQKAFINCGSATEPCKIEINLEHCEAGNKRDQATLKPLTQLGGYWTFSASGEISRHSAGQCLDQIATISRDPFVDLVAQTWRRWHLNDLQAGTLRQTKLVHDSGLRAAADYDQVCALLAEHDLLIDKQTNPQHPYRYGSAWLVKTIPNGELNKIRALFVAAEIRQQDGEQKAQAWIKDTLRDLFGKAMSHV